MIRTRALTKRYGELRAVDAIDLEVAEGDVYGFLGANGSGKTTTVRMLLGLVLATSGEAEVLGRPMPDGRRSGAAPDRRPGRGSGRLPAPVRHGQPGAARRHRRRPDCPRHQRRDADRRPCWSRSGWIPADRRPTRTYSLGMRQRLGLAAALLRRPRLLVLDEPTNGLDPQGIHEIRQLLLDLNAAGTTIFLSSHLLAEIEQMCTRVGVLDRGRLVLQEQLDALLRPTGLVVVRTPGRLRGGLAARPAVIMVEGDRLLIRADDPAALNAYLVGEGVRVVEVGPYRRDLERVVLEAGAAS